ncbi:MAG: hypothetical protein HQL62_00130, partial [Magnetococcales bacterium]|nr:hypothetical protein [Magnetococcales bacterium]
DKAGIAIQDARGAVELARAEGEVRGEARGKQKGAAHLLRRQLHQKFGPTLPKWIEEKLALATLEELEVWIDRMLAAQSFKELFKS